MSKVIACDFDGTIAKTNYPDILELIPEAQIYLRKWRHAGHRIILWTCREGIYLDQAVEFCRNQGILFHAVNENLPEMIEQFQNDSRKIGADIYIDDKLPMPIPLQFRTVHQMLGGHSR